MNQFVELLGSWFSPEQYVFWTRIQCSAWTLADLVLVLALLRLSDVARKLEAQERHIAAHVMFWLTVPLAVAIPFARNGGLIFVIELGVTVPHFAIILYILAADARTFAAALRRLVSVPLTTSAK